MDADIAGSAYQVVYDRAMQDFKPARALRLADDDVCDVILVGKRQDVIGRAAAFGGNGDGLAIEAFSETQGLGDAVALLFGQLLAAPRFDAQRRPRRAQAVG